MPSSGNGSGRARKMPSIRTATLPGALRGDADVTGRGTGALRRRLALDEPRLLADRDGLTDPHRPVCQPRLLFVVPNQKHFVQRHLAAYLHVLLEKTTRDRRWLRDGQIHECDQEGAAEDQEEEPEEREAEHVVPVRDLRIGLDRRDDEIRLWGFGDGFGHRTIGSTAITT